VTGKKKKKKQKRGRGGEKRYSRTQKGVEKWKGWGGVKRF